LTADMYAKEISLSEHTGMTCFFGNTLSIKSNTRAFFSTEMCENRRKIERRF